MNDEEKKAIERLKNIAIYIGDNYTFSQQGIRNLRENLRIVLPVIEKQSKELEQLKDIQQQICNEELIEEKYVKENYVAKGKIKAKIEVLDKQEEDLQNSISDEERKEYSDASISWELMDIQIRREVLQSLLEKE